MVIVYPGKIEADSTIEEMVGNIDFAPTVLDVAGLEIPEQMQGLSMKPLFRGDEVEWRDNFFYEYWVDLVHEIPTMTAVRTARHKLIQYPEIDDVDELYDLVADPHEMKNLVGNPAYTDLYREMKQRLESTAAAVNWQPRVFPKNLDRLRGPAGPFLNLTAKNSVRVESTNAKLKMDNVGFDDDLIVFDGNDSQIEIPFAVENDPSSWPYELDVMVKPESDGVILMQSGKRNGYKLFVQDGRPGIALLCKTWIAINTTIDAPDSIIGKWTRLTARVDYNRLTFWVNGKLVESRALPQPFKGRTNAPVLVGGVGEHKVSDKVPHEGFQGYIKKVILRRPGLDEIEGE